MNDKQIATERQMSRLWALVFNNGLSTKKGDFNFFKKYLVGKGVGWVLKSSGEFKSFKYLDIERYNQVCESILELDERKDRDELVKKACWEYEDVLYKVLGIKQTGIFKK